MADENPNPSDVCAGSEPATSMKSWNKYKDKAKKDKTPKLDEKILRFNEWNFKKNK